MLIIFDLDDTLIDTSGSVTPFKLKECLKRFIEKGLKCDFELGYQRLLFLSNEAASSKDALEQFLIEVKGDFELIEEALFEMHRPLPPKFSVQTTPHAKEILELFSKSHVLALVTGGHPPFQLEKLEKAGIDKSFFSKIAIPEDSIKKPFYEGLIREFSVPMHEVLVCGDRIAMDLSPARSLGCRTVHMRWGRGKQLKTEQWIHHSISHLGELKQIVKV